MGSQGKLRGVLWLLAVASLFGCSSGDDDSGGKGNGSTVMGPVGGNNFGNANGTGSGGMTASGSGSGGTTVAPGGMTIGSGGMSSVPNPMGGGSGGMISVPNPMGGGSGGMTGGGMSGMGGGMQQLPPPGPDDGDPNKPVVTLPDVACHDASAPVFGIGMPNLKVDDRDVILDYPCDKHEGAPMTFILNLHGTTPVEQHFYQEGYFSAYQFVSSHNLIIATPSSVVQQWGNMDDGKDEPYLMHVIDYVYQNLGSKYDIRAMWVGGHSWGAFYTSTFVCKDYLKDKVKGAIIMSGSPQPPACTDRIALIDTNAEMDIGPPLDQGNWPMMHGCDASMMKMDGNNTETFWPNCDPGFVHANYLMLGKMHTDFMDKEVVQSIVDWIKLARP
jgi:hypothetical protein